MQHNRHTAPSQCFDVCLCVCCFFAAGCHLRSTLLQPGGSIQCNISATLRQANVLMLLLSLCCRPSFAQHPPAARRANGNASAMS
jgi:hypothetical protein